MLGLFEFFKSGKMIFFILCLIALYMALRFVFFYYIPTALNIVTMYFIHSIMVCLTIFFAVPLNNSVEMSDIDTNIQVAEPLKDDDVERISKEQSTSAPQPSASELSTSAPLLSKENQVSSTTDVTATPQYPNSFDKSNLTDTLLQSPQQTPSAPPLSQIEPISPSTSDLKTIKTDELPSTAATDALNSTEASTAASTATSTAASTAASKTDSSS